MQRGRGISGEIETTFPVLNLVESVLVGDVVEPRVRRVEEILLFRGETFTPPLPPHVLFMISHE